MPICYLYCQDFLHVLLFIIRIVINKFQIKDLYIDLFICKWEYSNQS